MQTITSAQYFKALSILCLAFMGGLVLFALIVMLLCLTGFVGKDITGLAAVFNVMVPLVAIGGFTAGIKLFKDRIIATKVLSSFAGKMEGYRVAIILLFALLDGAGIFSIIACFITGEIKLLIVAGGVILIMLYRLPKKERLIKDLELSFDEANIVNDPDGVIQ